MVLGCYSDPVDTQQTPVNDHIGLAAATVILSPGSVPSRRAEQGFANVAVGHGYSHREPDGQFGGGPILGEGSLQIRVRAPSPPAAGPIHQASTQ